MCTGEALPEAVYACDVTKLEALADYSDALGLRTIRPEPADKHLRICAI